MDLGSTVLVTVGANVVRPMLVLVSVDILVPIVAYGVEVKIFVVLLSVVVRVRVVVAVLACVR